LLFPIQINDEILFFLILHLMLLDKKMVIYRGVIKMKSLYPFSHFLLIISLILHLKSTKAILYILKYSCKHDPKNPRNLISDVKYSRKISVISLSPIKNPHSHFSIPISYSLIPLNLINIPYFLDLPSQL
jgi:hypothetical protein